MRWIPFKAAEAEYFPIFTSRKRSKVMFPQASVYRGGDHMWPLPMIHWTPSPDNRHGTPRTPDMETTPHLLLLTSGDNQWRPVLVYLRIYPLTVLTSGGGLWNMYNWQAGDNILLECFLVGDLAVSWCTVCRHRRERWPILTTCMQSECICKCSICWVNLH